MKTTFNANAIEKHGFMPRYIALVLLAGILLVLGARLAQGARSSGAEVGQTLPGGWAGGFCGGGGAELAGGGGRGGGGGGAARGGGGGGGLYGVELGGS